MTVSIIGKDKKRLKRVTCDRCLSILEYTDADVKQAKYTCMGDTSGHDYVPCPECGPDYWAARIKGTSY